MIPCLLSCLAMMRSAFISLHTLSALHQMHTLVALKLKVRQYPAIHINYIIYHCTTTAGPLQ